MTRIFVSLVILLCTASLALAAAGKVAVTPAKQGEFAHRLVDALGWGEGLPEKPEDKDYLAILEGNRTFRFEAEETYDKKNDNVTFRNYPLFGSFSGKGWIHGPPAQTAVHFKIFIPISGNYTLKVAAKGDGLIWSIAGKAFKLNAGETLKEFTLGQLFVPAGALEFNAVLPPGGAVDYYSVEAPPYRAVAPLAGWNFSTALTKASLNETAASLLAIEQNLPIDPTYGTKVIDVATTAKIPAEAILTETQIYGTPTTGKWVRATLLAADVVVPFEADATSVYNLRARVLGSSVSAGFDQNTKTFRDKSILEWVDYGSFRLQKGSHPITVKLPPSGGIDAIEITRRLTSEEAYAAIVKTATGSTLIQQDELDLIVKSLQEQFKERK